MPRFEVAQVSEEGQPLLIVPLDPSFGNKTLGDQQTIIADIQSHADAAGLAGKVILVWSNSNTGMSFIAPLNWHHFFKRLALHTVWANINHEISW
jgi:hypothetical protein